RARRRGPPQTQRRHRPRERPGPAPARRGITPRDLHTRLRFTQLRRGKPALRVNPGHAPYRGTAHPGTRCETGAGDLRHREPLVRHQARRGGADRRAAAVPTVHGHPVRRPSEPEAAPGDGRHVARGRAMGVVRHRPAPTALGGGVRVARWSRPCGTGGQPLPVQGGQSHERPTGGARGTHRGGPRRDCGRPGHGPPHPRIEGRAMSAATPPQEVTTIACIGTGVIGGGWAAHFLARGYAVRAWDPGEGSAERLSRLVEAAWPALTELGLADGASLDNLTVAPTLADAVDGVGFVQESAPESLSVKRRLLADIDAAAASGVVIASSTSGFAMTDMQVDATTPERLV